MIQQSEGELVKLEWYEMRLAAQVGLERRIRAMERGHQDCNLKSDNNRWTDHIEGALAEKAVAKYLGRFWSSSIDTYRVGGDVGQYQVRSSAIILELNIRDRDNNDSIFIKAFGQSPTFRLMGWIVAGDAKRPEWLSDRGNGGPPCYWVPCFYLNAMELLKDHPES